MNANIDTIQKEIDQLFEKYEIPVITKNISMPDLQRWSGEVANHFGLDNENFRQVVAELFWSIAHVQLSLGHAIMAMQECDFVDGTQGIALNEEDVPSITMPEIYFWYHVYNSHECIYRCWERINNVIKHACFPKLTEEQFRRKYFPQTISDLQKDTKYNKNPHLEELQNLKKHRKRAADIRNEISHGKSSPMRNMEIDGKTSRLLGANGLPFIYLEYSAVGLKKEIDRIINKYEKVLPAMKTMVAFIDNI